MKTRFSIFFVLIAGIMFAVSCSKGGSSSGDNGGHPTPAPNDTIPPVVTINTPTANQVFTSGNTISITGRITDDLGLFQGTIKVTDDATGTVLKLQQYEIHYILQYDYNVSYTTNVTTASDYTGTVSFMDHGYNTTTKSVKVKVNP
jgi:phosphate-selective porin